MRRMKIVAVASTALAAATILAPAAAFAGSQHAVSGTVLENGNWFLSSTIRTSTGGSIEIDLTDINNGGNDWRLVNESTGKVFGSTVNMEGPGENFLATGVISGTEFQNNFKIDHGGGTPGYNYNFSGEELY